MQTKWLKWEVIAVVVAAIVMIGLLLIKPIVGLADNGDFERIMIQIGLAYPDPNEARVDKYFSFIHHLYAYVNPAAGDYVSSQLFLMVPALWIGKILPGPWFDIRVLAVEYIMIFLLALYLIVKLNKTNNKIVNGFLVTLTIVVFADIGYILYFNSMYG
ncbi:glycan biosynthesis hexose transferase WsfD, partial [Bacillus toyonensis]